MLFWWFRPHTNIGWKLRSGIIRLIPLVGAEFPHVSLHGLTSPVFHLQAIFRLLIAAADSPFPAPLWQFSQCADFYPNFGQFLAAISSRNMGILGDTCIARIPHTDNFAKFTRELSPSGDAVFRSIIECAHSPFLYRLAPKRINIVNIILINNIKFIY